MGARTQAVVRAGAKALKVLRPSIVEIFLASEVEFHPATR